MTAAPRPVDFLYERDDERAVVAAALSAARVDRGRIVLVTAPAGLGKTSVLKAGLAAAVDDERLTAPSARLVVRSSVAAAFGVRRSQTKSQWSETQSFGRSS